jgi:hypothetical protein
MIDREPLKAAESGGASGRTVVLRDLGATTAVAASRHAGTANGRLSGQISAEYFVELIQVSVDDRWSCNRYRILVQEAASGESRLFQLC